MPTMDDLSNPRNEGRGKVTMDDLLKLPNEGRDKVDYPQDKMEQYLIRIAQIYKEKQDMLTLLTVREEWNAFLDTVLGIMEDTLVINGTSKGLAIFILKQKNISDLGELRMAENLDDVGFCRGLPERLVVLLKECRKLLDEQKRREALYADRNLDEFSRLEVEKETNNIKKISYVKDNCSTHTIWERVTGSAGHNFTEKPSVSALNNPAPLDCDTDVHKLIASVHDEFHETLLNVQIAAIKHETLWNDLHDHSGYGDNRGEMVLQQAVYPPFALVLLAAASKDTNFVYIADQDVLSSSFVFCDSELQIANGQPDAALLLKSRDPLAEIEIKPSSSLNHQDLSKCILWSSITGQALQEIKVPREDIALPFLIGSEFLISLFVTTFPYEEDQNRPEVTCMHNLVSLLDAKQRIRVFVDFVLLVGKMKKACKNLINTNELQKRKKTKAGMKNLFSNNKSKKKKIDESYDKDGHKNGDKGSGFPGGGLQENQMQVDSAGNNERRAMMAVSQVCPATAELRFPWRRVRCLFDEEPTSRFQQRSPFFFRGVICESLAFFKVWRLGDADVVESFIRDEVRLLKHARDAGVSVPSILHQGYTDINGSKYFVLAMEDAGSAHEVGSYDELVSYSLSLLQNTKLLHSAAGVLHCDLKPDNIVWNADRKEIILVDFGHAQEQVKSSCVRGTKGFTAIEVDHGEANTRASDDYGVGATLRFLQKEVPGPDQLGICAITDALTRAAPNCRISLDEAHRRLEAAQMERDHPTEHHSKKMKTGSPDKTKEINELVNTAHPVVSLTAKMLSTNSNCSQKQNARGKEANHKLLVQ